jgi:PemK-like, MazF-like toxin of type II toxin-antitoxin system
MGRFVKGDVVVVPFPFSDLTMSKRRPALVLADLAGDDLILCQITSQSVRDSYAVELLDNDFISGSLRKPSNIRPNRLFTADRHIVLYKTGSLKKEKIDGVIGALVGILKK